jgi:hypothetical protein
MMLKRTETASGILLEGNNSFIQPDSHRVRHDLGRAVKAAAIGLVMVLGAFALAGFASNQV